MRTSRLKYHSQTRVGSLSAGVHVPQYYLHEEKRVSKVLLSPASSQSDGPWAPIHPDPFRVHGCWNTKDHRTGLHGECVVAPSVLPHQWHDECMRELCQELTKHMARASLQGKPGLARPTARSRRCSNGHSASWAQPPQPGLRGWGWPSDQEKTPWQDDQG